MQMTAHYSLNIPFKYGYVLVDHEVLIHKYFYSGIQEREACIIYQLHRVRS